MQLRHLWVALLVVAAALCRSHGALAVTVALTTTRTPGATDEGKQLLENLLALMEVEASRHAHLEVVERLQLDLALHELVLSNSRSEEARTRLGKLAGADLILTAKLLEPDESDTRSVHLRITAAQTAVVRGETLVPTSAEQIEETATEIVDYLSIVSKRARQHTATIAVLPFESVEQFDRLRPLERGLRDLFTSCFLQQQRFRVVQRTTLEQLLNELELVRKGLTRDGQGLERAPMREAVYVLRGEIDESVAPEESLIVIRAELVDPQSRRVAATVKRATKSANVADSVTEIAA
jgi:TolB-like protein